MTKLAQGHHVDRNRPGKGGMRIAADDGTGRADRDRDRDPRERNAEAPGSEQRAGLEAALAAFARNLQSTPAAAPVATMHLDDKTRESLRQRGCLPE